MWRWEPLWCSTVRVTGCGGLGSTPAPAALVSRWADTRRELGIRPFRPLICTLDGGQIDTSYVRHLAA
jgi:hypothetical protein